MWSLV
jgi:hypothetical protein